MITCLVNISTRHFWLWDLANICLLQKFDCTEYLNFFSFFLDKIQLKSVEGRARQYGFLTDGHITDSQGRWIGVYQRLFNYTDIKAYISVPFKADQQK